MATAQHELIEHHLPPGMSLRRYVATKRRAGLGWRALADALAADTGVHISHTTLRRWFGGTTAEKRPA
ncbi:helix-turn-helix DNA binding domain protein [Gordonia phage Tarzan]|uniref:Helix-turn-helix DNA binding domain protein n=1 Tax=Gordonia phage Tarzan TaxID=3038367 RepID=A0AAF0GEU3_9CAUD|nr:helix-turn-helix DNA binding domain protein [Gordonia phage Tarzan]WGH20068.1 helix-turn-helix DNA binding domain protein [Gordonia phage Tarzan]